jgi:hypothetical protein
MGFNAAFTFLCGVAIAIDPRGIADAVGLGSTLVLWILAAVYFGFGALLALTAWRARRIEALIVTVMDVGYVLASVGVIVFARGAISNFGHSAVGAIAALVAILIALQLAGVRRLQSAS